MKIKQITCTISHTINLGNFNSLRVEWGEVVELEENEQNPEAYDVICKDMKERVKGQVKELETNEKPSGSLESRATRR